MFNLSDCLFIASSFLLLLFSVTRTCRQWLTVRSCQRIKYPDVKQVRWRSWDQKFIAATSKRAPSSWFAVLTARCSPERDWRDGSTSTSEHNSYSKLAVMFRSSLCHMMVYPPWVQLRQSSTVKDLLQTQLVGRPIGSHPYLTQRASLKDDLCRWKLCSWIGSTDN